MVNHNSGCDSSNSWNVIKRPTIHRGLSKPQILLNISCASCGVITFIPVEMCGHRPTDEVCVRSVMKEKHIRDPERFISFQNTSTQQDTLNKYSSKTVSTKPSFSEIKLVSDNIKGLKFLSLLLFIAAIMIGAVVTTYAHRDYNLKCAQGQILNINSFSSDHWSYEHSNKVRILLSDGTILNVYVYDHEIESTPLEMNSVTARMKKLETFRWKLCSNKHLHLTP